MKKDPYAPLRGQLNQPPTYWRSIEHKEGHASVVEAQEVEFPNGIVQPGGFNRREALKLATASLALGAAACDKIEIGPATIELRRPEEEILPFVRMPEKVIPGLRMSYATAMQRSEGAVGLVVEAHEGRPTKIEGNPNHPSSLGGSDIWAQAEVLRIYDPERARSPKSGGADKTWADWDNEAKSIATGSGKGLALLVPVENGPTFERLLKAMQAKLPEAKIYRFDPLSPDASLLGAELAFGAGARAHHNLEKAKIILAVESDFLNSGPDHLRLARQFGTSRAVHEKGDAEKMKRLYASEAAWSTTGTNADHRLRLSSGLQLDFLKAVGKGLAARGIDLGDLTPALEGGSLAADASKFATAVAADLAANKGASVIIVGENQPAAVHALAHALNSLLGAVGESVVISMEAGAAPRVSMYEQLAALTKSLGAGEVQTLVIIDGNPLYTAPGALKFGDAMAKAQKVVHVGMFAEETGAKATWHLPQAHFLESWNDARAWDGTVSLVQPLILPLFGGRSDISVLGQLAGEADFTDKALVEATWRGAGAPLADVKAWRRALHDGIVANSARTPAAAALNRGAIVTAVQALKSTTPSKESLELIASFGHAKDGRLTNVSWIMELPDTMSKLCWDNAVMIAPLTAKELGLTSGMVKNSYQASVVELSVEGRSITAPAFVVPGLAANTVVLSHGYGRQIGEVAKGIGADVNPLLASGNVMQGVKLTNTGKSVELCSTQDHFSVPGNQFKEMSFLAMTNEPAGAKERTLGLGTRPLFRSGDKKEYVANAEKLGHEGDMPENLVQLGTPKNRPSKPIQPTDEIVYEGQQWGMVIDLSACIGCNACAIACIAENNIPVVGREQVLLGREMHWIRVDRYFSGDVEQPIAVHQPVTCMQCENAPCEPVCPVGATTHDEEGLNSMAYNRCIGTRYCANNCPYKVRRYNYLDFTHTGNVYTDPYWKERMKTLKLQRNPDVTVRYRGVMEKCTYCTQRVEEAKRVAKRAGNDRKKIPDGAITPACAQACPTSAITFGNINDPESRVHKLKVSERNYEMLQELNVRPRTSYLARVRNENEELS